MSLNAVNPFINATVSASAGSGKTWLLITRIVRLLLAGAEPGNILALTFTRKAAGEMQIRLNQRLLEMATASDEKLIKLLKEAGCDSDEKHQSIARDLYEKLLHNLYPVRLQTFHSFCQDILSKFPIEADIPPGFELLEDTGLLEQQAWQALFVHATQAPDSALARHLNTLMDNCNGGANTRTALDNFVSHRSDWWAFTRDQSQAVDYAHEQLSQTLQIPLAAQADSYQPTKGFFSPAMTEDLLIFANFLREQPNAAANAKNADIIDATLKLESSTANDSDSVFHHLKTAFLTKASKPLARKDSKVLQTKLGAENAQRFLELHASICEQLLETIDIQRRLETLVVNHAWCYVGEQLLGIFQQLKRQQRLLDFVDLEWKCFQLINQADNAQWIQYKIDQRIDHILIDEFQDTNPTQWHLLAPILEEIAAAHNAQLHEHQNTERWRSVFLVGDEKQSIYSFRRANPKLQAQASDWLAENLDAQATPLDASRRSSQAIMDCVNNIFLQDKVLAVMPGYTKHETWLKELPGKVCLSNLFQRASNTSDKEAEDGATPIIFRNPLEQPRLNDKADSHFDEAQHIATQIQQLVDGTTFITDEDGIRRVEYGDIMILMRNRVHIETYENILRQQGIPFIGSKRGGLLDNVEIQDLIRLLETLITPFNNLALAQVLKSPIFSASDEDLKLLAECELSPHWYDRLQHLFNEHEAETLAISQPLSRAAKLLPHWRELAGSLPIHDCLDKIFVEANILQRYSASTNDNNKRRVAANCQRLLELSLENDSGRYPGISHFLEYLKNTQQHSKSPLDEPLVKNKESRVSLLTIHASKGLEAPIIFLADCNSSPNNKSAYATYVHWPEDSDRPLNFMLQMGKKNTDSITTKLQIMKAAEAQREDLNLLYVALTRAREQLYISGIESRKKDAGWYELIKQGLENLPQNQAGENSNSCFIHQHLNYPETTAADTNARSSIPSEDESNKKIEAVIDTGLQQPIAKIQSSQVLLAPSKLDKDAYTQTEQTKTDSSEPVDEISTDLDAKLRGMIIHRAIELLSSPNKSEDTLSESPQIQRQLAVDFCYPHDTPLIQQCYNEAKSIVDNPEFSSIFSPDEASNCYNELPILYLQETTGKDPQSIYGLIDRVIKTDNTVTIIDYKSHRLDSNENPQAFAEQFRPQLRYYQQGLEKIWPELEFKTAILFTHTADLIWL